MLINETLFHVPCPIFWKDLDGAFLGCNKLFLEIGGFCDYSQLIGKKDTELPWRKYNDEYYKDDQYVIKTGKTITRVENIPLPNRVIISETTKTPLMQDGKIIGVLGICQEAPSFGCSATNEAYVGSGTMTATMPCGASQGVPSTYDYATACVNGSGCVQDKGIISFSK